MHYTFKQKRNRCQFPVTKAFYWKNNQGVKYKKKLRWMLKLVVLSQRRVTVQCATKV